MYLDRLAAQEPEEGGKAPRVRVRDYHVHQRVAEPDRRLALVEAQDEHLGHLRPLGRKQRNEIHED